MKSYMGVKKSKPRKLPRHHEMKVDEIIVKAHESVHSSLKRIKESKALQESSQKMLEESRLRKKK